MAHGGKREGAGRKAKADELELIERLKPLDDSAYNAIARGIENGEFPYVKLFMDYRYGKPPDRLTVAGDPDSPILFKLDERFNNNN